ncbi:MAG: molybdate ABC transporter substrate-binding protein [Verrucomicrobia bacterium]|nr:molybdate ABC transporter substrate-binding protein [Verrucomicrobiota bacterium]
MTPRARAVRWVRKCVGFGLAAAWLGVGAPRCPAAPATVTVAAASDLVFCLEALHAQYAGARLTVSTGSSGNLFAQIRQGAPFDVFLSADMRYPRELIAAGEADPTSLTLYGIGRLVLWTTRTDLDLASLAATLRHPQLRRFAIANPSHAPYGRAARELLENTGVWIEIQPRLVLGENISQTAQFIQTGSADAGLVALSLVAAPALRGTGRWLEIPGHLHAPLEQGAVLTRRGAGNAAARDYLVFLRSPQARAILDRFGFRLPAGVER